MRDHGSSRLTARGATTTSSFVQEQLIERITELAAQVPAPAVAVAVVTADQVVASLVRGTANLDTGEPATHEHWWDLASLTKTLVTLPEVLWLVDAGADLHAPLAELWPPARDSPVGAASLAALLSHNAGLPPSVHYFRTATSREELVAAALATPLERPIGAGAIYSDTGFVLLGEWVAYAAGCSLPELARRHGDLRMGPPPGPAVATERCLWRGRLVAGEVHDENAAVMGGAAGHAGAFGRLEGVAAATHAWLTGQAVSARLHAESTRPWSTNRAGDRFGLGWWLTPTRGLGGPLAGPDGFGHSGFVGNRVWVEPVRGYAVVVLSNRVHPVRTDRTPFNAWCARLLEAVATCHQRPRSGAVPRSG
jgi:CubicO group peptidase (beta-lactamase class C family)